jgi:hypothetical protein
MAKVFVTVPFVLGLLSTAAAATFEPPKFQWKDSWTYQILQTTQGVAAAPQRTEFSTMYTVANGSFLTGVRSPSGGAWAISGQLPPNKCLPFVAYQQFNLDDRFCAGPIEPGSQFVETTNFGKRITKFDGMSSVATPMGTFEASHFSVVDVFEDKPGDKPSLAREVRSELWHVAALRTFVRLRLRALDAKGSVLDAVDMDLVAASLKP